MRALGVGLLLCRASAIAGCSRSVATYAGIPLAAGAANPQVQSLARRAQAGDKHAQLELGIRYEQGRGLPRDLERAAACTEWPRPTKAGRSGPTRRPSATARKAGSSGSARAGRKGAKFPWGNEPDSKREALGRPEVPARSQTPWDFREGGREINRHLSGVKVGLFPPNDWGLHDVMGNVRELTSDTIPGEVFFRRNPGDRLSQFTGDKLHAVLKGSDWIDRTWTEGIDAERYAIIYGDRYLAGPAIRLILIEGGRGQ